MNNDLIKYLTETRYLNPLHCAFGEMVRRHSDVTDGRNADTLELLAALVLRANSEGHSCLDIDDWKKEFTARSASHSLMPQDYPAETLRNRLNEWAAQCLLLKTNALSTEEAPSPQAPLFLEFNDEKPMVFLKRFRDYEINIATRIEEIHRQSAALIDTLSDDSLKTNIRDANKNFFGRPFESDYQQQAVFNTLRSGISVITGGPGRGKTTVLSEILALALKYNPSLDIAICAPTGKAAARMKQAVANALEHTLDKEFLDGTVIQTLSKLKPCTVHSLLGLNQDTDYPKANETNTLNYDLIAVDECSMLSLQMFSQLLSALKSGTRLILLGDENQLESVDSGEVLAALCRSLPQGCVNRLKVNYRSRDNQPLCDYTDKLFAVENPDMKSEIDALYSQTSSAEKHGIFHGIEITRQQKGDMEKIIRDFLKRCGLMKNSDETPDNLDGMFKSMENFKILSPVYDGTYGVDNLNSVMRRLLHKKGIYDDGVPVLITQNDKITGLLNGDTGVCKDGKVHFRTLDANGREDIKHFNPAQLPEHTCAYAISIHKSQGSDYENVLMTLPPKKNFFLTKKLIYTGMTRTKKNFLLLADKETLMVSQLHDEHRWSLLAKRIEDQFSPPKTME